VKKILVAVSLLIFFALIGVITFLLNRPSDYQAHFTVKTTPDVAYFNILNWDMWNRNELNPKFEVLSKTPVSNISKKVTVNDTTLIFNWEIKKISDSVTLVRAYVSDPDRKFYNRLTVPFINTHFKNDVRGNLLDIKTRLELMLKSFHYKFTGPHHFEKKSCVCINLKSTVRGKAMTMITNVAELNQFVRQNKLERDGPPFLVFQDWDEFNDSVSFDFCFPIKRTPSVPEHPKIKFMTVEGMDAIKTDFYGNYSITDITWHNLDEEAKKLGYRGNHKLIEVYYNDPHSGGNELEWKAEIYLGIESVK
jgi:effector-binding domain-containing protein